MSPYLGALHEEPSARVPTAVFLPRFASRGEPFPRPDFRDPWYPSSLVITESPRLVLREFEPADLDALAAILADPEVMHFASGVFTREQSLERLESWIENYRRLGFGIWAVVDKQGGALLGLCGLAPQVVDGVDEVEIGYRFRRDAWGRGYATEAAVAVRIHGFEKLGLRRVISIIEPANVRSLRVAEKNGMRLDKETMMWNKPVRIYAVNSDR